MNSRGRHNAEFRVGRPEPDRAEPGFQAAGTEIGLDVNRLSGLGLTITKISGSARSQHDFFFQPLASLTIVREQYCEFFETLNFFSISTESICRNGKYFDTNLSNN